MLKKSVLIGFVLILLLIANIGFAQERMNWKSYLTEIVDSADDNDYVYLNYTKGNKRSKLFYYFKYNGDKIIAVVKNDTVENEIRLSKPDIFSFLIAKKKLQDAREYQSRKKTPQQFWKQFEDTSATILQLGIRFPGMHYNHFQPTSEQFISSVKKERYREALRMVNEIVALLEKAVQGIALNE